jgi:hypothetical protein
MFEHQERTAILLLVAVAVCVIAAHLVLGAIGKHPFASDFSGSSPDGELVCVQGTIDQVTVTKNGGHILLKIDNVTVFVPAQVSGKTSYTKGQNITVYGTVQTYQGAKEIVVGAAEDIGFVP